MSVNNARQHVSRVLRSRTRIPKNPTNSQIPTPINFKDPKIKIPTTYDNGVKSKKPPTGPRTPRRATPLSTTHLEKLKNTVRRIMGENEIRSINFYEDVSNYICRGKTNCVKQIIKQDLQSRITFFDTDASTKMSQLTLINSNKDTGIMLLEKYACLTFFQYLDIRHDAKHTKGMLASYTDFLLKTKDILASEKTINDVNKYTLEIYNKPNKTPTTIYGIMFRQMMLTTTDMIKGSKANKIHVKRLTERTVFLNVLNVVLKFYKNMKIMKKDSVVIPKGRLNADRNTNDGIISLDMTNKCLIQQFTSNYSKYVHLSNLGDFGIRFLPDIDIQLIVKKVLRTYGKYSDTQFLDAYVNTVNNNHPQRKFTNNVYFDTQPFSLILGEYLTVEVINVLSKDYNKGQKNHVKGLRSFFESKINPHLRFISSKGKTSKTYPFKTADEAKICNNYICYLQKHLGDFMQAANSITKDIIFASGDSLACLGYLIAYTFLDSDENASLIKPEVKLMWEDATNQQIVYVTSSLVSPNRKTHFHKLKSTNVTLPNPLTKDDFDKIQANRTNTNVKAVTRIPIQNKLIDYNPYNVKLNRNVFNVHKTGFFNTNNVARQIMEQN